MKRRISYPILLLILVLCISGCSHNDSSFVDNDVQSAGNNQTKIVTGSYPVYSLTQKIIQGIPDIDVVCLIQPQDRYLHSYTLSDWDAVIIATADIVIIGGNGLESFGSTLYDLGDTGPIVISCTNSNELSTFKSINRGYPDHINPYVFLCTRGIESMLRSIAFGMETCDPDHADQYRNNLDKALQEVEAARDEITGLFSSTNTAKVIVLNEALCYASEDLGFEIEAHYGRESGSGLSDVEFEECLQLLGQCESKTILIEQQAPADLVQNLSDSGYTVIRMNTGSTMSCGPEMKSLTQVVLENAYAYSKGIVR